MGLIDWVEVFAGFLLGLLVGAMLAYAFIG